MSADENWVEAARVSDIPATRKHVCQVAGREVLLVRLGQEIVAVSNRCAHLDQPLDRGRVMAGQITCPFHGACFDLRTGEALSGPAVSGLRIYPVQLRADAVWLRIED